MPTKCDKKSGFGGKVFVFGILNWGMPKNVILEGGISRNYGFWNLSRKSPICVTKKESGESFFIPQNKNFLMLEA